MAHQVWVLWKEQAVNTIEPPGGSTFEFAFPGAADRGRMLVEASGLWRSHVPIRYRTAWTEETDGDVVIAIVTRLGREEQYADEVQLLRTHPWWMSDVVSRVDETYRTFRLLVPADYAGAIVEWLETHDSMNCNCGLEIPDRYDCRRDIDPDFRNALDRCERGEFTDQQRVWIDEFAERLTGAVQVDDR